MGEIGGEIEGGEALTSPQPLSPEHDLSTFSCGSPELDAWLRHRALRNEGRFSRTYVMCRGRKVVGYYCISAGALGRAAVPGKLRRNAPDMIPVSVIGRLAVSLDHAGQGLGADLLLDAFGRIAAASRTLGISAVLVQAKDERAKRFYLNCADFIEYPEESRLLLLPIETVIAAFS
ncbi:GNAT family N-acetyltransferase [Tistrella mobilis]|uniref:GNAT family N-acetyltransferase n=1 Tax=Tistrella mobilis TaxID=171437 RepID=UPI0031F72026